MAGPSDPREPDAYGRLAYRGLIAWPERLQREAPLIERSLAGAPSRRALDLGCGSGEHSRLLRALGYQATGVDASTAQLEAARGADPEGTYLLAALADLPVDALAGQGAALCLGNTLPHLCEEAEVHAFLERLGSCLLPGAPFLLQLLNYDRILDRGERVFPLVVRPGTEAGEETLFLRLMTHHGDGRLTFTPASLRHRPGTEVPLEVVAAHEVALRGWRRAQVEAFLAAHGFTPQACFGAMTGEPWSPVSQDLVLLTVR